MEYGHLRLSEIPAFLRWSLHWVGLVGFPPLVPELSDPWVTQLTRIFRCKAFGASDGDLHLGICFFFFLLSVTWINWNVDTFQYFSWFSLNLFDIIEYSCIKLLFFYLSLHFIDVFVYFIISQYAGSNHYHLARFGCWKSFTDASWQAGLKDSSHFAVSASQPLKDSRKLPLVWEIATFASPTPTKAQLFESCPWVKLRVWDDTQYLRLYLRIIVCC